MSMVAVRRRRPLGRSGWASPDDQSIRQKVKAEDPSPHATSQRDHQKDPKATPDGLPSGLRADPAVRAMLERRVRAATTPQRVVRRSRIALMWLDGQGVEAIATTLKVSRPMVRLWIRRFASGGPDALLRDAPRRGRPVVLEPDVMRQRLEAARLLDESGRPISVRRAAAFLGVSATTVWRALKRSG